MPDITITIPTPQLTPPQYFKVRYRPDGGLTWTDISPKNNTPFVVAGLAVGVYEFEVIVVLADGSECPPTTFKWVVVDFECPDFTVTIQLNPFGINISYSGGGVPPCGWRINISDLAQTGATQPAFNPLPASPFFIPVNGAPQPLHIRIIADLCDKSKICFEDDILLPEPPVCTPMTNLNGTVTLTDRTDTQNFYRLNITGTQSNPVTPFSKITVTQVGSNPPIQKWTQTFPNVAMNTPININLPIAFNIFGAGGQAVTISWFVVVEDICGKTHTFVVTA